MNPEQKQALRELLATLRGEKQNINMFIDEINLEREVLLTKKQEYVARKEAINILIDIIKENIENK